MSDEYDAFGRKKGEDPLAGLGAGSFERPSTTPAPAPSSGPISRPSRPPHRRRRGGLFATFAVAILVAGIAALTVLGMVVTDEVNTGAVATDSAPAEAPEEAPAAARKPPRGLERGSLIRRGALTGVLQEIRSAQPGGIVSVRVDPEDVSVQIKTRDGYLRHVSVRDGELTKGVRSGPGFGHVETIASRNVDPAAPERLVRAASRRMKRSPNQANYLVLMNLTEPTWGLFFKDGVHFQGDARGRIIRRTN